MNTKQGFPSLILAVSLLLPGCVQLEYVKPNYTSKQQEYVDKIMALPLEVNVDKDEIQDAWGRAQSFISKYSDLKLQIVTDYSIQTFNSEHIFTFAYSATKTPVKGGFSIAIDCNSFTSPYYEKRVIPASDLNAHIFSYYVKTGELPFPELIRRFEPGDN